jgi:Na+/melibiose symporter-like transporter
MTFALVFTQHLPTLALVALGARESAVGLQQAFPAVSQALQLPALRAVGRTAKRRILILGQALACLGAVPFLFFGALAEMPEQVAVPICLTSLGIVAAGLSISSTVWFPLLRAYVEAEQIGRFFGILRSVWHLVLIVYYIGAQRWLSSNPGSFALLFGIGWALGVLRIGLIAWLPERSERTGEPIRIWQSLRLVFANRALRRYMIGATWVSSLRMVVVPFWIVMMRREAGLTDGDVIATTVATFSGGLASLYLWGRLVDRVGAPPVFRATSLCLAACFASLLLVEGGGTMTVAAMIAFAFTVAVLWSGFGVADTHVLFKLTPGDAPAPVLVTVRVIVASLAGTAPILAGLILDRLLATTDSPLTIYHALFATAAALQIFAFLPLRRFVHGQPDGDWPG